jgi:putative endonuclease
MSEYHVYIIECNDGTYYVGKTKNIEKRLKEHNGILPKGAKYTLSRRPVILRYVEAYATSSLALKREYELKQLSHKQKQELIFDHFMSS